MSWNLLANTILLFGGLTTVTANQSGTVCQERIRDLMEEQIGIFEQPPENFNHTIQVSACLVQVGDRILALQRGFHKFDPGKWEVPGGKFLEEETLNLCASRELFEETGIKQDIFQEIGVLYVRRKESDFTLRVIVTELHEFPDVQISKEHHAYRWVTADEMRNLDLIKGEELLIDMYLKTGASENN
jgi:8-oxo-dGTP pyrophosphatase MutT (NUDIX family)